MKTQQRRVLAASVYIVALGLLHWSMFGTFFPGVSSLGTWFYAGLAMVVLAAALTEPFYATPGEAAANGIAALLVAIAFAPSVGSVAGASAATVTAGKQALIAYAALVIAVAVVAIALKDRAGGWRRIAAGSTRASNIFGRGRVVYSLLFLGSSYAAYARQPATLAMLFVAWTTIVAIRPVEAFIDYVADRRKVPSRRILGEVVGIQYPGLVEIRARRGVDVSEVRRLRLGPGGHEGLVLDASPGRDGTWILASVSPSTQLEIGFSASQHEQNEPGNGGLLVGTVEAGTRPSEVYFRAPYSVAQLSEGHLVTAEIRGLPVLFQVVDAKVRSESLMSGVQHRYIEAVARKIGVWREESRDFLATPWLPMPGEAIRLSTAESTFQEDAIGCIPGSNYAIRINADWLVTHNTAILGILGIGKTYLSFELIRRVLLDGKKVVVLDVTGEYAEEFNDLAPEWILEQSRTEISDAIAPTRNQVRQNVHEGGNIQAFRQAVANDLGNFLESPLRLKVYNPDEFDATRQDSRMFGGTAALAPLTVAETTRIISEELLRLMAGELTREGRVWLVLEEAHSLAPEWNSTSYDADQKASNGTAKAVLQGRKFGLGVMIVTQRTANVTKTILNQCHTVFSMRTFDATGMEFLSNYIGDTFTAVLSGLEDRTAVVFGRASSCPSPVIVRINDHDEMVAGFWDEHKNDVPVPEAAAEAKRAEA